MELIDRRAECGLLDEILHDGRSGESRVLVLHGDPGVGKSALMDYVVTHAAGCRLLRAAGVESEMELAHAAVHQLCAPTLDRLDHLPPPQRDALRTAFGLGTGPAPDRLLIGLAVLSLLSDVAEDQPLVCLIDDMQWLDAASAEVLSFVAKRLGAESVVLIMATRVLDLEMSKLPKLELTGLRDTDARELLEVAWAVPLDERVRDQIVAETRGNPLALLELPRDLTEYELVAGFGMPSALRLSGRIEESYERRLAALPERTRRLLLIAAAEPTGDPILMWRAAARLGIGTGAALPAVADGLAEFGIRVRFRHPLVRSATYRAAPLQERQVVHQALADVTDLDSDPDRRAWHRAQAAQGPDEGVAAELERSADRARARGGLAARAAFLERAMLLTLEPARRAERALAAASAKVHAGAFDAALDLLTMAEGMSLTDFQIASAALIRAQLAYVTGRGSDAPPLLLKAAQRLEPIDAALSRATYLEALSAAIFAGRLAVGAGVLDVARAVEALPRASTPLLSDLLLEGLATYFIDGNAAALPILRRAVSCAHDGPSSDNLLRCLWQVGIAALHVWDDESWERLSTRHVELARSSGALTELPLALTSRVVMHVFAGELNAAEILVREVQSVTEATGSSLSPNGAIALAAFRGDRAAVAALTAATTKDATTRGEGIGLTVAEWTTAVLNNGLGRYGDAIVAVRHTAEEPVFGSVSSWAAAELVEAGVRSGATEIAADALSRLAEITGPSNTDWALGVEARARALLSDGAEAERLYRSAIERLGRTRIRTELARARLLYGEWLRRERRRIDARTQLRFAHDMFDEMGMEAFAERARRELLATGETARKRTAALNGPQLTAQEAQIARLAADGLTNPEIGARLFISPKTVQYHLSNVFPKLGISSRSQLHEALISERR
ncbi:helix-turn-helix transcriptional regulator [Mycolicibacterium stellerae]|uniref:helix-turn-helix transcriptional regulator n=1 Tax=Mycolicibacterium stellerae TaxID=2358193 RepID=UPI000F0B2D18|nr:LuxR family transcriptional regulator [Mycolicibacterium stellerae]